MREMIDKFRRSDAVFYHSDQLRSQIICYILYVAYRGMLTYTYTNWKRISTSSSSFYLYTVHCLF